MLFLNILIIITILLQLVALSISLRLMKVTKFNAAWILFSIAFSLMLTQLLSELFANIRGRQLIEEQVMVWFWVLTALCFTSGLFVVNQLISYINKMDRQRRISEERILNTIITTEEKERRRFSSDMHDGIGPLLSAVKMSVSALSVMDYDSSQREILDNAEFTINEAIKSLREISNNLNPHILNNFGVSRAINSFINKLTLPQEIAIKFSSTLKNSRYNSNIETIIYRVTCELINNALKHSQASEIEVDLQDLGGQLVVSVKDNGIGFDYGMVENGSVCGMGLSSIASRISSIKGNLLVDSSYGEGSKIVVKIKIKRQRGGS